MATRITVFEVITGDNDKSYFDVKERRCSACGKELPQQFEFNCPNCGERFFETLHDYVPKEG